VERVEEALRKLTGQAWDIRFESVSNDAAAPAVAVAEADKSQSRYRRQRAEVMQEPLLKRASEALGAQIVQMDEDFGTTPSEPDASPTDAEES
jgi:hypothetical protein